MSHKGNEQFFMEHMLKGIKFKNFAYLEGNGIHKFF